MNINARFMDSSRAGAKLLVIDDFLFTISKTVKKRKYLKCWKKCCVTAIAVHNVVHNTRKAGVGVKAGFLFGIVIIEIIFYQVYFRITQIGVTYFNVQGVAVVYHRLQLGRLRRAQAEIVEYVELGFLGTVPVIKSRRPAIITLAVYPAAVERFAAG